MNITLLQEVKQRILKEPGTKTNMNGWCGTSACIGGWAAILAGALKPKAKNVDSVTAWRVKVRTNPYTNNIDYDSMGTPYKFAEVLGLTPKQGDRLFYVDNWPKGLREQYVKFSERHVWGDDYTNVRSPNPYFNPDKAKQIVAQRIDHFIKVKGKR